MKYIDFTINREGIMIRKIKEWGRQLIFLMVLFLLFGCSAAYDLAHTGAGKVAQIENINFFKTTTDLKPNQGKTPNFPDYYYISSNVAWAKYKKIIVNDFSSMTSDVNKISGLQIPEFKNIRKDIPDNIAQSIDGSIFLQCIRSTERIDHTDINRIKNMQADAILFGNISEFKTGLRSKHGGQVGLTSTQVEIKLVDRKTGQEIIKIVNRSTTDGDKVAMPIIRRLAGIINTAKNPKQEIRSDASSVSGAEEDTKGMTSKPSQQMTNEDAPVSYLIVTKKTNIRAGDSPKSKIITTAKSGEKVEKIDASEKCFKVRTAGGKSGWILKSAVKQDE